MFRHDDPSFVHGGLERGGVPFAWEYGGVGGLGGAYSSLRGLGAAHRGHSLAAQYPSGKVHPNLAMLGPPVAGDAADFGYAGQHAAAGADYLHRAAAVPLLPQRVVRGAMDHQLEGIYIGDGGRNRGHDEIRGRGRSPRRVHASRSSSGGRHRPARRGAEHGIDRYGDTEDSQEDETDDAEIAARVEGVEEELRALVEDTQAKDEHVQEQVARALSMAEKIGSGRSLSPPIQHIATWVICLLLDARAACCYSLLTPQPSAPGRALPPGPVAPAPACPLPPAPVSRQPFSAVRQTWRRSLSPCTSCRHRRRNAEMRAGGRRVTRRAAPGKKSNP